jgi:hypothetical protein
MKTAPTIAAAFLTTVCAIASISGCTLTGRWCDPMTFRCRRACGLRIAPEWALTDRFNIVAKIPAGTSEDQVRAMPQNLLLDRFRMTVRAAPMRPNHRST